MQEIRINVIPISFGEVTSFITPDDPAVISVVNSLTDKSITALHDWVAENIEYIPDKEKYDEIDLWQYPRQTLEKRTGDCEDFSFLLVSMILATGFPRDKIRTTLGRMWNYDHAWVEVNLKDREWLYLDPAQEHPFTEWYTAPEDSIPFVSVYPDWVDVRQPYVTIGTTGFYLIHP